MRVPSTLARVTRSAAVLAVVVLLSTAASGQDASSTAGLARSRRLAEIGRLPEPGDVIVSHIINYHRHGIPLPKAGEDVALDLRMDARPGGRAGDLVLQVGLATQKLHDLADARAINLALVIDCSGSMAEADKMSRVQRALRRLVRRLRAEDHVSVVAYSTAASVLLDSRRLGDGREVAAAIDRLQPRGSTNLHAGLMLGYEQVARHYRQDATNRVILLTDGIANAGVTDPARIAEDSRKFNAEGMDLSVIGVGVNLNRELLETLATRGRGLFHFVASERDIDKVFDAEVQSLVGVVARKVRLDVDVGPGLRVEQVYGYDPVRSPPDRSLHDGFALELEDFNNGLTNVVLAELHARPGAQPSRVRVTLSYERPDAPGKRVLLERALRPVPRDAEQEACDHEVRKNHTIAVMAAAMKRMAQAAHDGRLGAAEHHVRRALRHVRALYPRSEDADLERAKSMLEQYERTLAASIERFRDC